MSRWQRVVEAMISLAAGTSRLATSSKPAAVASLSGAMPAVGRLSTDRQFSDDLAGAAHTVDDSHSILSVVKTSNCIRFVVYIILIERHNYVCGSFHIIPL